jgi:hypothetical protein
MLNMFYSIDESQPNTDEHFDRVEKGEVLRVGDFVWMNPDTLAAEWRVLATHLFTSPSAQSFCLVEVAKREVGDRFLPGSIEIYLMDGEVYTYAICGGEKVSPPTIGPFVEYEPGSTKTLPVNKEVVGYEQLTGDGSLQVYLVDLKPARVPVAA